MAEYRRGTGPDALPQGGASQANAATPTASDYDALALENTDIPVQYAPNRDEQIPNDDSDVHDDLQILLEGPDPEYQPALMQKNRPGRVPSYVVAHLPQLMAAAKDPAAPPTLVALKNSIIRHLEDEQRRGG